MISKNALLILGLLAIVVLISARDFPETSSNYEADDQKQGGGCSSGTDCFGGWGKGIPGWGIGGGMPGWGIGGGMPGGGMPGGGMPGGGMPGGGMAGGGKPGGGYGGGLPSSHV